MFSKACNGMGIGLGPTLQDPLLSRHFCTVYYVKLYYPFNSISLVAKFVYQKLIKRRYASALPLISALDDIEFVWARTEGGHRGVNKKGRIKYFFN